MNSTERIRQPWMHDMKPLVVAPAQLWETADGTVDASQQHAGAANIAGFYVGDTRIISRIIPVVNGEAPTAIAWNSPQKGVGVSSMVARNVDGPTVDPSVRIAENRTLEPDALHERYVLRSVMTDPVTLDFSVKLRFDMASMQEIKGGASSSAAANGEVILSRVPGDACSAEVTYGELSATVTAEPQDGSGVPSIILDGLDCVISWQVTIPARAETSVGLHIAVSSPRNAVIAANADCPWADVQVEAADNRVSNWVNTSLRDLDGLRMSIPALPDDEFLAAGAPWFFTLFGRDSLWAARFMLPLTTRTAMGALRTLAHFQATESDIQTNADPGKIMHELRAEPLVQTGAFNDGTSLPPLYYGTIDATELWIILLAEALRWGAPEQEIEALLPNLEAALAWLRDWGDCDGDGFLEYIDRTGHGLSNQGWKDSGDSVRWNDGRIADGPIALCEVQGYAYQAAILGADVLEKFGRPGAEDWRAWAKRLKTRFNEVFWVDDGNGRYPAIALDRDKKPVDSLTSNIGHLLGTGILDEQGVRDVVARLVGDDMLSGYGVRTMSTLAGGYWPESYHCGSVWAHDSAIVMNGLRAEGYEAEALRVADGLVRAADAFDYQIPELYSGDSGENSPSPYPAACHPQAWSAASSVSVLSLLLGLEPCSTELTPSESPLARGLRLNRN